MLIALHDEARRHAREATKDPEYRCPGCGRELK